MHSIELINKKIDSLNRYMDMAALLALSSNVSTQDGIRNADMVSSLDAYLYKLKREREVLEGKIPFLIIEHCLVNKPVILKEEGKEDKAGVIFKNVMGAVWVLFEDSSQGVYAFDERDSVFSENPRGRHLFSL